MLLLAFSLVLTGCAAGDPVDEGNGATNSSFEFPAVTDNGAAAEPTIAAPSGEPPTTLQIKDLTEGTGDVASAGSTVTVNYTGMSWSNGQTFDSSWLRGEPITFPLANLILGWQQGIPGMKVGGRRLLVIPPDLGYGEAGGGSIGPNETLVFVVELKAVQ